MVLLVSSTLCSRFLGAETLRAGNASTNCSKLNPFLVNLRQAGVMTLKTPLFNISSCGSEWTTFGTCCDFESLKSAVNRDLYQIKVDEKKMVSLLLDLRNRSNNLPNMSINIANVFKNQSLRNLDIFKMKSLNLSNTSNSFSGCWDEMRKIRSSSVCVACSGRS